MLNVECFTDPPMPTFQYKALQSNGTMAEGQIEANGRPDAFRQIEVLGLRPISLAEKAAANGKNGSAADSASEAPEGLGKISFGTKKVSGRDLENFTRLLSSLLAA